jgi:hypothetical protein
LRGDTRCGESSSPFNLAKSSRALRAVRRFGQHGLHCVDRGPLGTFTKNPGECREDRVLVALRESWSPRPPVRVAALTRFPGPQISETRRLGVKNRHRPRLSLQYVVQYAIQDFLRKG